MGRPRLENKRRKTAGVSVSEREMEVLELLKEDLGYKSVSALLRSAISKGIEVSSQGKLTSSQDVVYWQYWKRNWELFKHIEEIKELETSPLRFFVPVNNVLKKKE